LLIVAGNALNADEIPPGNRMDDGQLEKKQKHAERQAISQLH
jgi:hypothetical protein